MKKLIILDRDGVINWDGVESKNNINLRVTSIEKWQALPGSLEAIGKLKKAGFIVCIATNQSIVSKGIITLDTLDSIHNKMQQDLKLQGGSIDQIFVCPHQESENCSCRKPKPGMLLAIAKAYNVNFLEQSVPFVGDSDIDILAAIACGCVPVLVKTGKGKEALENVINLGIKNLLVFEDLNAFVDYWISIY